MLKYADNEAMRRRILELIDKYPGQPQPIQKSEEHFYDFSADK
jgi:hypothetical protein